MRLAFVTFVGAAADFRCALGPGLGIDRSPLGGKRGGRRRVGRRRGGALRSRAGGDGDLLTGSHIRRRGSGRARGAEARGADDSGSLRGDDEGWSSCWGSAARGVVGDADREHAWAGRARDTCGTARKIKAVAANSDSHVINVEVLTNEESLRDELRAFAQEAKNVPVWAEMPPVRNEPEGTSLAVAQLPLDVTQT